jgi:diadenosine tetraphosphate (Ap4A) HIT family hydrolase
MNMLEFNRQSYERLWDALNGELSSRATLKEALIALEEQQLDAGFIKDDLKAVIHFRLHHPRDRFRILNIQYNSRRADRYAGMGRKIPPPGCARVHQGCFLCKDNIRWQQQGVEVGYDIHTGNRPYIAWMNPFPLKPVHTTLATREHTPQQWVTDDDATSIERFRIVVEDLLELAERLPGFIGFYNGVGAGASVPDHFHFHFFQRPEGSGPFPLERAAGKTLETRTTRTSGILIEDYPITVAYFRAPPDTIIRESEAWVERLLRPRRYRAALSTNVIAAVDSPDADQAHLYLVPRNKYYTHAPGMVGMIGGLEVLGELVFSTDVEKHLLDTGQVDFFFAERILSAVEPLGIISEALR